MLARIFLWLAVVGTIFLGWSEGRASSPDGLVQLPRMHLPQSVYDVGRVVEGETIRQAVVVENTGGAPLLIGNAESDCTCTTVDYMREIPAGAKRTITVEVDTLHSAGDIAHKVRIISNDATSKGKTIVIKARVVPVLTITPQRFFLTGTQGRKLHQTAVIRGNKSGPFELAIHENTLPDDIACTLTPRAEPSTYQLTIESVRDTVGVARGRVILASNYPERPLFRVPVMVRRVADFEVFPQAIDFGAIQKDLAMRSRDPKWREQHLLAKLPRLERDLVVRLNDPRALKDKAFTLTDVQWDSSLLEGRVTPAEDGLSWVVRLVVRAPQIERKGVIESSVVIRTNHPGHAVIKVPVRLEMI